VLASFEHARAPSDGPVEVPIGGTEPIADEWAVICVAPGHSACLIGWETVGTAGLPDEERAYLDRIPDSSRRSQLRLAGAITARAFATS
jgi:hypothetical protein